MQSAESLQENVEARDGTLTAQEILSEIFSLAGKDVVGFTTLAGRTCVSSCPTGRSSSSR